jgi:uncharacterized protein
MRPKINSLLIKPAGPDCNIACRYCFYYDKKELFDKTDIHRMDIATARKALREYLELAGPQASLGFQGGEPTLCGLDFFKEIAGIIKEYKRPGQQCSLAIQTNGILLDEEWAEFFKKNNVLVGLSVDGPEDIHNTHRLDRGRKGTHKIVAGKMQMLKDMGVEFNTLTVITKANVGRAAELIEYFRTYGSSYMQFIPCVESLDGGIADYSPTPEEYGTFLKEAFDLWFNDGYPEFYVRLFEELLISFVEYVPASCYFAPACASNLVVEHDGSIYPCDFFVENEWKLGNINENSFAEIADNPKLNEFIERKRVLDEKCKSCEWRSLCFGDCPKYRLSESGAPIDSAYFCEGYKDFFEHAHPRLVKLKKRLLNDKSMPKNEYWNNLEKSLERNSPCPCGSGQKFKKCCQPVKSV